MKKILPALLCTLILTSCSVHRETIKGGDITLSNPKETENMIIALKEINKRTPRSFYSNFTLEGRIKTNKFKFTGNVQYNSKTGRMHLSLLDFIFKSPVSIIYKDKKDIAIYIPSEKKIFRDTVDNISLKNYFSLDADFKLLYSLLTGKIPLIKNYDFKQGYKKGRGSLLQLENSETYEIVSFKKRNIPDRFSILQKKSKEKFEIYIRKYYKKNNSIFFKKISIINLNSKMEIDITFHNTKLNIPLKVKTIDKLKIPGKISIIKM